MNTASTAQPEPHPLLLTVRNDPARFANKRAIDIARLLGVSELEWVDAQPADQSIPLACDAETLLQSLPALGPVMALTRNHAAVHEKEGRFGNIEFFPKMRMAQVANHDIDLRIFLRGWAHLRACETVTGGHPRRSMQIFNTHGEATHKIFALPETDDAAWSWFVATHAAPGAPPPVLEPRPAKTPAAVPDVDGQIFRDAWDAMRDTHEFFPLLKRFGLARMDALRLAGGDRAVRVDAALLQRLLENAAASGLPIMVFVGNAGCIQIHTGPIHNVMQQGPWLNILDPGFNLHLRSDLVNAAWVVRKPTADGVVTSLELYDSEGTEIALFFGERKPGRPERSAWRELIETTF